MKQLLFFLFLVSLPSFGQDFSDIETKVLAYPKLISSENLASKISTDFSSKEQQIKAAFFWITQNIRYDLEAFYNPNNKRVHFRYRTEAERIAKLQEIKDHIVTETLQSRKAVCEGYAQTLSKICTLLNIENEVIKGYIRNSSADINNPKNSPNHAWNAVKLNDNWMYIDATWAAGAVTNGKWHKKFNPYYYNIPTTKYFKTHYPENKLWQLRVGRMSLTDFYRQPIYDSSFLQSNIELITPKTGIASIENNEVTIQLKNSKKEQDIRFGFLGYPYAMKPTIHTKGTTTVLTINVPKNATNLFLLIDKQVAIEFLIK